MTAKNDPLFETLRRRRDEYSVPMREGGWEKLEAELLRKPASRRRRTYRWMAVAAAVLLGCLLSLPFLLKKDIAGIALTVPQNPSEKRIVTAKTMPEQEKQYTLLAMALPDIEEPAVTIRPVVPKETEEKETVIIENKETDKTDKPAKSTFVGPEYEKKGKENYTALSPEKNKQHNDWAFSISAGSNGVKTSASESVVENSITTPGSESQNGNGETDPGTDNPGGGMDLEDDDEDKDKDTDKTGTKSYVPSLLRSETETPRYKYHHKLPITIGLSVRKNITNRFGLESGLTYTYLHSDISKEGQSRYAGHQKLHYIGIPLRTNWTVYDLHRFSIYLSGGALFEYCLSARLKLDNQTVDIDPNRFQASLNAAAGMQVLLVKPLSFYVEPGISYYFDNGSDLETIRTDKPLMFNLQAGIRFTY